MYTGLWVFILYTFSGHMVQVGGFMSETVCNNTREELVTTVSAFVASKCFQIQVAR